MTYEPYNIPVLFLFRSYQKRPLKFWDKKVKTGWIQQLSDPDLRCYVLEIIGLKSSGTYITCPADPKKVLGIRASFLHFTVKNLQKPFIIDVLIKDSNQVKRRFKALTGQKVTQVKPSICKMPLTLANGWNEIVVPLREYTQKAYGTEYTETLRVQVHATCRMHSIFFSYHQQTDLAVLGGVVYESSIRVKRKI